MGNSSSAIADNNGTLTLLRHKHQSLVVPLLPSSHHPRGIEFVPTCGHEVPPSGAVGEDMPYGIVPVPGIGMGMGMGIPSSYRAYGPPMARGYARYPAYGGNGDSHMPHRICGYCHEMAHPGPCDANPPSYAHGHPNHPRSRYRYQNQRPAMGAHDGHTDVGADILAALHNWRNNNAGGPHGRGGGCNHNTCADGHDGSFRVRGKVDDRDVDLKLGGSMGCPCAEFGGCEAMRRRAMSRSRSRSRRRRERREGRRGRKHEGGGGGGSGEIGENEGEPERGRKERIDVMDKERVDEMEEVKEELRKTREDVKNLRREYADLLKEHATPAALQPDLPPLHMPEPRPYYTPHPEFGSGRPPAGFERMPRRAGWQRPGTGMNDEIGMGMGERPPHQRAFAFGRTTRTPMDEDMELPFERRPFDFGDGPNAKRDRPGLGRRPSQMQDEWGDLDELDDEVSMRPQFGFGVGGRPRGRGPRYRARGGASGGMVFGRCSAPAFGSRKVPRDAFMFGGLDAKVGREGGDEEDGEEEDELLPATERTREEKKVPSVGNEVGSKGKRATKESVCCSPASQPVTGRVQSKSSKASKSRGRPVQRKAGSAW